jgi:hypothetical protein
MGRTQTEFAALTAQEGLDPGHRLPWLTNRGHLHLEQIGAPIGLVNRLREIYLALGGDEDALASKRAGSDPTPDFLYGPSSQLLELDEIQHFTSDRKLTLEMYPDAVDLGFDIKTYRDLCETWSPTGDRYRATKQTRDFPHAGGRRAQRAYFDTLRDLAAPALGNGPVIRIPAPECDSRLAHRRFLAGAGSSRGFPTTAVTAR